MKNYPKLASKKECTGCLACVDSCRTHALSYSILDDGHIYPTLDYEKCIKCKRCEKACPIVSSYSYLSDEASKFYAAWNTRETDRRKSASGGFFSAIARYVLQAGGVVIGASQHDDCVVKHIVVDRLEDLHLLLGSKYTQSITLSIFQESLELLKKGKWVLFSGTGCQIAGLKSFLDGRTFSGGLTTIDLICGGVPSKLLIETFKENEPVDIKTILSYRTKENGWSPNGFEYNLKIVDKDGIIHDYTGKRDIITKGFAMELTNRLSCYDCKFSGVNRKSDFTIGDFWGIQRYDSEFHDGISLVVAHNKTALALLEKLEGYATIHEASPKEALKHNYRLYSGKSNGCHTLERKMMPWMFKHLSYRNIKRIYAYEDPGTLYKIYFHITRRIINMFFPNSRNRNR